MNSIVIGSGFGGIAAALRLKAKGHKVTLIEKHPDLGGRARVFRKNGFIFDGGPTVITAPYLINELFELFKKDPKDYIKLSPLKVWYQFVFEDKSKVLDNIPAVTLVFGSVIVFPEKFKGFERSSTAIELSLISELSIASAPILAVVIAPSFSLSPSTALSVIPTFVTLVKAIY